MTAEEAYAKTMMARRNYVLEKIDASARNCRFEVEIWYTYLYKELEDELVAAGYTVTHRGDQVTISWDSPKKVQPAQSSMRAITFD